MTQVLLQNCNNTNKDNHQNFISQTEQQKKSINFATKCCLTRCSSRMRRLLLLASHNFREQRASSVEASFDRTTRDAVARVGLEPKPRETLQKPATRAPPSTTRPTSKNDDENIFRRLFITDS